MKIVVDAAEAAERLEELIDLVSRADEVFVCRGERSVAQRSAWAQSSSDATASSPDDDGLTK